MKNLYLLYVIPVLALLAGASVDAWDYTFLNHTKYTIAVKLGFAAWGDKVGPLVIRPGEQYTFKARAADWRMSGLCLNGIWYRKSSAGDTPNAIFNEVNVHWLDSSEQKNDITTMNGLTKTAEEVVKKISNKKDEDTKEEKDLSVRVLGKVIGAIGGAVLRSGCTDREYHIWEVADKKKRGEIVFVSYIRVPDILKSLSEQDIKEILKVITE